MTRQTRKRWNSDRMDCRSSPFSNRQLRVRCGQRGHISVRFYNNQNFCTNLARNTELGNRPRWRPLAVLCYGHEWQHCGCGRMGLYIDLQTQSRNNDQTDCLNSPFSNRQRPMRCVQRGHISVDVWNNQNSCTNLVSSMQLGNPPR